MQEKQFPKLKVSKMRLVAEFSGYTTGPILLGIALGMWLDKAFAAQFWFSIGGLMLGIILSTFLIVQRALQLIKENENSKHKAPNNK